MKNGFLEAKRSRWNTLQKIQNQFPRNLCVVMPRMELVEDILYTGIIPISKIKNFKLKRGIFSEKFEIEFR